MGDPSAAPQRTRLRAGIAFGIALIAAIFSALDLHGWHIYFGLGLTTIAALYGLMRWKQKYPRP